MDFAFGSRIEDEWLIAWRSWIGKKTAFACVFPTTAYNCFQILNFHRNPQQNYPVLAELESDVSTIFKKTCLYDIFCFFGRSDVDFELVSLTYVQLLKQYPPHSKCTPILLRKKNTSSQILQMAFFPRITVQVTEIYEAALQGGLEDIVQSHGWYRSHWGPPDRIKFLPPKARHLVKYS